VPSKDDKTFWDYAPNIFPILLAVGFFIYAEFFSEGRDSTSAFFSGLSILAILWALSVRESLKSIKRSMEQMHKSIERDFLGHWWGELDDDKEEEKRFEQSITGRLQSIEISLKSISPVYPEELTDQERSELYECSTSGRLQSIKHSLESIESDISGDKSHKDKELRQYAYNSSIKGRLQSVEHSLEHTLKSIDATLKSIETSLRSVEVNRPLDHGEVPTKERR
jgi:hypothetical protein